MTAKAKRILLSSLWILAAALFAVAGIGCMVNSGDIMSMLASWIGILVVLSGLAQLTVAWLMRETVFGDRGFLTKGLVAVVVGLFIMCKSFIAGGVLQVLISMMILVDAISILGAALAMRQDHIPGRGWLWLIGAVELVLGVAGFLKPELLSVTIGILIGLSLVYEGLTLLYTWFIGMRWYKLLKR